MKTNLSSCVSYFKSQSLFFLFLNYYYFVGQAYGKKIVKSVPLVTTSGPVIYTNLIGFVPMLLFTVDQRHIRCIFLGVPTTCSDHLLPTSFAR